MQCHGPLLIKTAAQTLLKRQTDSTTNQKQTFTYNLWK